MDLNTKVYFSLSIGYSGVEHHDEFTLEQLGYDPKLDTDIEKFLEAEYIEWRGNYLDGCWRIGE